MPASRRDSGAFVHVFLITLGARIAYATILLAFFDVNPREEYYDEIARNLLLGHGYTEEPAAGPNLWRAPLYPFFLAGVYGIFGFVDVPVFLAQSVFDGLTSGLVFLTARRTFDERVATGSAVATALYPFFTYYTVRIFPESLFTFLLALSVWAWVRAYHSGARQDFVVAGAAQALGLLCKSVLELFPLMMAAFVPLLAKGSARRLAAGLCWMAAVTLLVIAPWTLRNYQLTGRLVPIGTGGGLNFWLSNHLPTGGLDDNQLDLAGQKVLARAIADIIGENGRMMTPESDRKFLRKGLEEVRESPLGFLALQARKLYRFWFSTFNPVNRRFDILLVVVQLPILTLAVMGILGSWNRWRAVLPLLLVITYFVVLNTVVPVTTFRYAVPIMPYVLIFAVRGLKKLLSRDSSPWPLRRLAHFFAQ